MSVRHLALHFFVSLRKNCHQARFTAAILAQLAGVSLPESRIHSTTVSGEPKSAVLARLAEAAAFGDDPSSSSAPQLHFVEDKLATLEAVCKVPALAGWRLYLVDWGYNTPAERERAAGNPRIRLLGRAAFEALLARGE